MKLSFRHRPAYPWRKRPCTHRAGGWDRKISVPIICLTLQHWNLTWVANYLHNVCVYDFKVESKRGADGTEAFRLSQHRSFDLYNTARRPRLVQHSSSVNAPIISALMTMGFPRAYVEHATKHVTEPSFHLTFSYFTEGRWQYFILAWNVGIVVRNYLKSILTDGRNGPSLNLRYYVITCLKKLRKTTISFRIVGILEETRTSYLPNTNHTRYQPQRSLCPGFLNECSERA